MKNTEERKNAARAEVIALTEARRLTQAEFDAATVEFYESIDLAYEDNASMRELAEITGLSQQRISQIVNRDVVDRRAIKARGAAQAALKSGRLTRKPCEACGGPEKAHMHHEDYSKPLKVKWLCRRCHVAEHAKIRKNGKI